MKRRAFIKAVGIGTIGLMAGDFSMIAKGCGCHMLSECII